MGTTGADQTAAGAAVQDIAGNISGQIHLELLQVVLVLVELVLEPDLELVVVVGIGLGVGGVEAIAEDLGAIVVIIGGVFGFGLLRGGRLLGLR